MILFSQATCMTTPSFDHGRQWSQQSCPPRSTIQYNFYNCLIASDHRLNWIIFRKLSSHNSFSYDSPHRQALNRIIKMFFNWNKLTKSSVVSDVNSSMKIVFHWWLSQTKPSKTLITSDFIVCHMFIRLFGLAYYGHDLYQSASSFNIVLSKAFSHRCSAIS